QPARRRRVLGERVARLGRADGRVVAQHLFAATIGRRGDPQRKRSAVIDAEAQATRYPAPPEVIVRRIEVKIAEKVAGRTGRFEAEGAGSEHELPKLFGGEDDAAKVVHHGRWWGRANLGPSKPAREAKRAASGERRAAREF